MLIAKSQHSVIKAAVGLSMLINVGRQIGNICTWFKYKNSNVTQFMAMPEMCDKYFLHKMRNFNENETN